MAVNATAAPQTAGGPPKRRLRNYLLDPGFQLKYTGMVVAVTLVVATILGYLAYDQSRGQTEMMQLNLMESGATEAFIQEAADEYDRNLLLGIVGGIAVLVISLGFTGILVTHRVVGPAYKLKSLFNHVADGHLKLYGKLRKGDELWDVFLAFESMIDKLRANQRREIEQLESVIERARAAGAGETVLQDLESLRDRMADELK
jgi:nitrogen fixation/metabolism regulation signal transduction histidine kinase